MQPGFWLVWSVYVPLSLSSTLLTCQRRLQIFCVCNIRITPPPSCFIAPCAPCLSIAGSFEPSGSPVRLVCLREVSLERASPVGGTQEKGSRNRQQQAKHELLAGRTITPARSDLSQ